MTAISRRERIKTAVLVCAFGCVVGLAGCGKSSHSDEVQNPLYVDPAARDFSQNPKLLQRILAGPHGYLRFINIPFSEEVCRRFNSVLQGTPAFNLHGDAHIEQYAVTDLGRGLTDFDDSSTGPAIIDLMRFGVSMSLACRANGWEKQTEQMFDRFLAGYRAALIDPATEAPEPAIVSRLRAKFKYDRSAYFQWVKSILDPMPEEESKALTEAMRPYVKQMIAENPRLKPSFFKVVETGYLRMGIGSALDLKYLVRVAGKTGSPNDDVVLEVKQVRDLSGIDCIRVAQKGDPFRVLIGQARIAYQPYKFLGYIRFRGTTFWVHSWVDNYREVDIQSTFKTPEELAEVAYDVGVQLGRGHTNKIAAPLDKQLRAEQIRFVAEHEAEIKSTCKDLTRLTIEAWERFRSRVGKSSG
ncbi:MAG: DUF2252 domain-containing protein [Calditrichaeota bacterium]|nr:MAG: DUF2252 domain-containing protein [Calditrichota bacterium]